MLRTVKGHLRDVVKRIYVGFFPCFFFRVIGKEEARAKRDPLEKRMTGKVFVTTEY